MLDDRLDCDGKWVRDVQPDNHNIRVLLTPPAPQPVDCEAGKTAKNMSSSWSRSRPKTEDVTGRRRRLRRPLSGCSSWAVEDTAAEVVSAREAPPAARVRPNDTHIGADTSALWVLTVGTTHQEVEQIAAELSTIPDLCRHRRIRYDWERCTRFLKHNSATGTHSSGTVGTEKSVDRILFKSQLRVILVPGSCQNLRKSSGTDTVHRLIGIDIFRFVSCASVDVSGFQCFQCQDRALLQDFGWGPVAKVIGEVRNRENLEIFPEMLYSLKSHLRQIFRRSQSQNDERESRKLAINPGTILAAAVFQGNARFDRNLANYSSGKRLFWNSSVDKSYAGKEVTTEELGYAGKCEPIQLEYVDKATLHLFNKGERFRSHLSIALATKRTNANGMVRSLSFLAEAQPRRENRRGQKCGPIIEGNMITMECQPGGHGAHLGHSMMMDPTSGSMHHQEQEHKKKRKASGVSSATPGGDNHKAPSTKRNKCSGNNVCAAAVSRHYAP
ncbi:hypothetical protein GEV33_010940 [Tenebrio molitor]|uniref:Uncharacterized protein n=1 Tax=Tenebrio molitor TaxID=7067 RepID=A0A8J6LG92_TENMO|nr:hypothetical protein GEV33_010940 [Tenebrio molitor]